MNCNLLFESPSKENQRLSLLAQINKGAESTLQQLREGARQSQFDPFYELELDSISRMNHLRLYRASKKIKNGHLRERDVRLLVSLLHKTQSEPEGPFLSRHLKRTRIYQFLKNGRREMIDQVLMDDLTQKIATSNSIEAFQESGFLKTPNAVEKFQEFWFRNKNGIQIALSTIFSIKASLLLGFPFPLPPEIRAIRNTTISSETLDLIFSEGIESARPEIRREYGYRPHFDTYWSWIRQKIPIAILATMVLTFPEKIEKPINDFVFQHLASRTENISQDEKIFEEKNDILTEQALENFREEQGRDATPEEQKVTRALITIFFSE